MKFPIGRHLLWIPLAVFVLAIAALAQQFARAEAPAGIEDVDTRVVTESSGQRPTVGRTPPRGSIDVVSIDESQFSFSGWADFGGGASLVLVTSGANPLPDSRIRSRSLKRPDVVAALGEGSLRYSGFTVSGPVETWGTPECLFLRSRSGARVLWQADGAECAG